MAERKTYTWPIITLIAALAITVIALPNQYKLWAPRFLQAPQFHFGLDLVGGTQLDFRISEEEIRQQQEDIKREIAELENTGGSSERIALLNTQLYSIEEQHRTLVEAIRTVLERRINAMGVSEAVITPSYIGDEKHLLVECPGVVNTQECIDTVGKTIQLEFKEEFTETTDEYEKEIRGKVTAALQRIHGSGESLATVGQDLSADIAISYSDEELFFRSELPKGLEDVWYKNPSAGILEREGTISVPGRDSAGEVVFTDIDGIFLTEVLKEPALASRSVNSVEEVFNVLADRDPTVTFNSYEHRNLREAPDSVVSTIKTMGINEMNTVTMGDGTARVIDISSYEEGYIDAEASHILIAYQGALQADPSVTRTKEEARILISELKQRLENGESLEALAREYSNAPSGEKGGGLGVVTRGSLGKGLEDLEAAIFGLTVKGQISNPVESAYGFHVIRSDRVPTLNPDYATYKELVVTGEEAPERALQMVNDIQNLSVEVEEEAITLRSLFFSLAPTGWKDTLLDGKHFRAATVTLDPNTNIPVVQISFDDEGAKMFRELTARNINKRLAIFVGGQLVSAPTVQTEIAGGVAVITGSNSFEEAKQLATDLNTGAIPAPIYLAGQRTVEATLGARALETSLKAAIIGIAILMVYMVLMYKILGFLADLALGCYALLFIAVLKLPLFLLSSQYIVLTLAGMAGIILSIGMAVDANVLIFERIKEELRKGKLLKTAAVTGFARAWPSIRDGNVSTFITCTILFAVGTSIVRGFAITLGMGVLLSMFSALVITRWFINKIATMPIAENPAAFGVRVKKDETIT